MQRPRFGEGMRSNAPESRTGISGSRISSSGGAQTSPCGLPSTCRHMMDVSWLIALATLGIGKILRTECVVGKWCDLWWEVVEEDQGLGAGNAS